MDTNEPLPGMETPEGDEKSVAQATPEGAPVVAKMKVWVIRSHPGTSRPTVERGRVCAFSKGATKVAVKMDANGSGDPEYLHRRFDEVFTTERHALLTAANQVRAQINDLLDIWENLVMWAGLPPSPKKAAAIAEE